jgi:hypothetical protein
VHRPALLQPHSCFPARGGRRPPPETVSKLGLQWAGFLGFGPLAEFLIIFFRFISFSFMLFSDLDSYLNLNSALDGFGFRNSYKM